MTIAASKLKTSTREIATILAALRNWQTVLDANLHLPPQEFAGHFDDEEPLSVEEINELCESINFGDLKLVWTAANTKGHRMNAIATLQLLKIAIGQDFNTLRSPQVEALLTEADRVKYRQPKNANGSRARYFHDRLQRRARKG